MRVSKIGMISGKPKIAIRVELLSALEEIADTNVKVIENPVAPKKMTPKNCAVSFTGLPATKLKPSQVSRLSKLSKKILYSILGAVLMSGLPAYSNTTHGPHSPEQSFSLQR